MRSLACVAVIGAALVPSLFSSPVSAQDAPQTSPPPDAPPGASPSPDAPDPPDALPPLDGAAQQKLLEELAPPPDPNASVPDLSKVNLLGSIPGVQSLNPDMSITLDVAGAWFGTAERPAGDPAHAPLMTGGHDPNTNGFTLRQLELAFSASVDPFLRFDSALVIKDELEIEEAYVTSLSLPWSLQARAGQFLSKFGRHNEQHPHQWWFIAQPLVYGGLLGEDDFRGLGAELSWLSPLPWPVTFVLETQGTSGACCSRTFSPGDDANEVRTPLDLVTTGAIEQFFAIGDDVSVLWGVSAMTGSLPALDTRAHGEIVGTDLLVRYKPADAESRWFIELQTEALVRARHPELDFGNTITDGGGYAQLVYHPNATWGGGARYDFVSDSDDPRVAAFAHPLLSPNTHRGGLVFEYAPTHFSRIQAEANAGTRGAGDIAWGAMINLEVAVGAHGAHAF